MIMETDFAGLGKRVEEQRQGSERKKSKGHMGEEERAKEKHALSSSALATATSLCQQHHEDQAEPPTLPPELSCVPWAGSSAPQW